MKKILMGFSLVLLLLTTNANAVMDETTINQKIAEDYLTVGRILFFGTISDGEDFPDAKKYLLKSLKVMKDNKLNLNTVRGAEVYKLLGGIYTVTSGFSPFDDVSGLNKKATEKAIKDIKQGSIYFEKSYKIFKKLGSHYEYNAKKREEDLKENKKLLVLLQKRLSSFK